MAPAVRHLAGAVSVGVLLAACTTATDHSAGGDARGAVGAQPGVPNGGKVRTYYIAAAEVAWNYTPHGRNDITGAPFDGAAKVFVEQGPGRIGSTYGKCLYRGYTDATFRTAAQRAEAEEYLGNLGPVIRAEVGDTVKVVFRNNCPFRTSIHPHGVLYDKDSEGAAYAGASGKPDDEAKDGGQAGGVVPTGGTRTYTWGVPERAGPGPGDPSSVTWMYHSHADEVADVYAGLSGFLVVTAEGKARPDATPNDVDREVFSLYEVDDENSSPLLDANIEKFARKPAPDREDEKFVESNKMHSINGYSFGNGPVVAMRRGEHVRWYLMGMGTEVDLHTPHWHGNTVLINGTRTDVANLLPASMAVADMVPDNPGTWLYHCHVGDHIKAGMLARYQVL